jgi:hypothetical protein
LRSLALTKVDFSEEKSTFAVAVSLYTNPENALDVE